MRQSYYEEKMADETRIRQIYHDMKNHLLVLENAVPDTGAAVSAAENASKSGSPGGRSNASTEGSQSGPGGIRSSIERLQQQISSYVNYYRTGNA